MFTKLRAGLIGAAALAVGTLGVLPASADVDGTIVFDTDTDGSGTADTADGSATETVTVKDAGGVAYDLSIKWNYRYRDAAGTLRVSVNPLKIHRSDTQVLDAGEPEDAGLDLHYDVYNPSGYQIQHRLFDDINLDDGADNVASFNPRNPKSGADQAKVRVKVGTDGDGLGSSRWVIFYQPAGLPIKGV